MSGDGALYIGVGVGPIQGQGPLQSVCTQGGCRARYMC